MVRIYLDWQIFKYLKEPAKYAEKEIEIRQLKSLLDGYSSHITLCYSPAHIKDLTNKNLDKLQDERLQSDLDFMTELTKQHFLNYENDIMTPCIGNANEVMQEMNLDIAKGFDINNLLGASGNLDLTTLNDPKLIQILQDMGINMEEKTLNDAFKSYFEKLSISEFSDFAKGVQQTVFYQNVFQETLQTGNQYSLFKDFLKMMQNILDDTSSAWKEMRNELKHYITLPTEAGNWNKDTIEQIEKYLQSKDKSLAFMKIIEPIGESNKTRLNYYISAFMFLEMLGYKSDSPNNGFNNLNNDMTHSFYAAHCNIFISEDKKLAAKSKALYEKFNIATNIYTMKEFIENFPNSLDTVIGNNFYDKLITNLKTENIVPYEDIKNIQEMRGTTLLYRLEKYFLGFFNRLEAMHLEEENYLELSLLRNDKRYYGDYLWYSEIEKLVANFYACFDLENSDKEKIVKFMKDKEQNSIILWTQDVENHTNKIAVMLNKLSDANISLMVYLPYKMETKK